MERKGGPRGILLLLRSVVNVIGKAEKKGKVALGPSVLAMVVVKGHFKSPVFLPSLRGMILKSETPLTPHDPRALAV